MKNTYYPIALAILLCSHCAETTPTVKTPTNAPGNMPEENIPNAPPAHPGQVELITFPSEDNAQISADLYMTDSETNPFIVLFHQAGWSRGEYNEIAPKLVALGYNCMAVDLRSGDSVNNVENQTAKLAASEDMSTTFLDALPDMRAALRYARTRTPNGNLIAWGSSYSSSLALVVAGEEPDLVNAVLSFSPGEYFVRLGKPDNFVAQSAQKITVPVFITSAKNEMSSWKPIYDAIPGSNKANFVPTTAGNHGSRALWAEFPDSDAYWTEVRSFLSTL